MPEETLPSVQQLREMHDTELARIVEQQSAGYQAANTVLNNRTTASNLVRLTVARMYGRADMMTFFQWGKLPCVTAKGTLGVVDICDGTAWDSGVACVPECDDLGYSEANGVFAGANNVSADLHMYEGEIDGKSSFITSPTPLQHLEQAGLQNVTPANPTMPLGWRQILLPTWRGYNGDGHHRVPRELYASDRLKPELVCFGLTTCYGKPGRPRRTLDDTAGHDKENWPDGVPEWITSGFEPAQPYWWPFTDEQRVRLKTMAIEWMASVCKQLAARLPNAEAALAAFDSTNPDHLHNQTSVYPDQELRSGEHTEIEREKARLRGEAARQIVGPLIDEMRIREVYYAGVADPEERYTSGYFAVFKGILVRLIYAKLEPVAESVDWMRDSTQSTVANRQPYFASLTAVGQECGRVLCQGIGEQATEMIAKIQELLYENGPVYMQDRNVT